MILIILISFFLINEYKVLDSIQFIIIGILFWSISSSSKMETKVTGGNSRHAGGNNKHAIVKIRTTDPIGPHKFNEKLCSGIDPAAIKLFKSGKPLAISHIAEDAKVAKSFSRMLEKNAPRMPYKRRKNDIKRALHWGQLKLFLTEVEFLNIARAQYREYLEKNKLTEDDYPMILVYAGAAPGHHTAYLQKLFPETIFELYDPNDFAVKDNDRLHTHVQFFTDADAQYWANQKGKWIVFVSDIRTEPATDENVKFNMDLQKNWWNIIQPQLSMFKFRLPWSEGKTNYMQGDIYIQPFPGPTSTESRLIVSAGAPFVDYDNRQYEEQMFYHNTVIRNMRFDLIGDLNIVDNGVDCCYDCTSMIKILSDWLGTTDRKAVLDLVSEVQNEITFGRNNILSETSKSLNDMLDGLHRQCFTDCNQPRCDFCLAKNTDYRLENVKGRSRATNQAYEAAAKKKM